MLITMRSIAAHMTVVRHNDSAVSRVSFESEDCLFGGYLIEP